MRGKASLLVGTYTSGGSSEGIYRAEFDLSSGVLSEARPVIRQKEPSYLALSGDGRRLYAVEEMVPAGRVFSYRKTAAGWEQTGCLPSGGSAPCHLAIDEVHATLAVANYMDGIVSIYPLAADGSLGPEPQVIRLYGSGPDANRQTCAHAHQCVVCEGGMWVCDLGSDQVRAFERQENGRYKEGEPLLRTLPGAGPRHLVASPDGGMLYLLCELQSVLYAFRRTDGGFVREGVFTYLPENVSPSAAAAVRRSDDGRFLFASSRGGFDGVALFELDTATGLPQLCGLTPTASVPRDILPLGDFLLCACQKGDTVQVLRLDRERKSLAYIGELPLPAPVCLVREPDGDAAGNPRKPESGAAHSA